MDKKEFEILFQKISPKLLSIARNFSLISDVEPEDVVQDTFIALWELSQDNYQIRNVEALAIKITKNICVSHYRKAHMETNSLIHDNYLGGTEATILTDREDLKNIRKSVYSVLTESQRKYLYLRNEEGMTLEEIAEITGRPKTSIKTTISAARKQILNLLKKYL